jgi:hypothetical protein
MVTVVVKRSVATQNSYVVVEKFICLNRGFVWVASVSSVNIKLGDIKGLIFIKLSMHIIPLVIPHINCGAFNFLHE